MANAEVFYGVNSPWHGLYVWKRSGLVYINIRGNEAALPKESVEKLRDHLNRLLEDK